MVDASGKKQRLLIVDDSKVIRVTARKILQDHFETVEATDGEIAWGILNNSEPFSLIVSDLTMPNLDGFGLLERIRTSSQPDIKDVPVIVITGANDSEPTKERATKAGATDFIGKPFDSVHLLARTQAHADAHTANKNLQKENIELEDLSLTDSLTDLSNETAFLDRGYEQVSYAIRHNTSLAIFRIEVDKYDELFKQHGNNVTESIIKTVADVLQSCLRQEDMAARIGPARFSLLLGGMERNGIRYLAERINRDISSRIIKQGDEKIRYSVSIGIAAPEIQRDTRFEELLSTADSRLVCATSNGGNQIVYDEASNGVATHDTAAAPVLELELEPVTPTVPANEAMNEIASQPNNITEPAQAIAEAVAQESAESPDTLAPVEVLATGDLLPSLEIPNLSPAPATDQFAKNTTADMQADTRTTSTALPPMFDNALESEEDTIIITAPFDSSEPVPQTSSESEMAVIPTPYTDTSTMESDQSDDNMTGLDIPEIWISGSGQSTAQDTDPKQAGFFKRLFAPIGRLFRRSS